MNEPLQSNILYADISLTLVTHQQNLVNLIDSDTAVSQDNNYFDRIAQCPSLVYADKTIV